jgi:2-keto-3-deoxy-L-rhamnonate aldolase RhmA
MTIARVPINEHWTAKRVLDMGVSGVIFPFTNTVEDAERAAASCRYPPRGKRGSGAGLTSFTWPGEGDYYESADENVLVVAVVEDAIALASIDEIASTEGVDVIFIGVSDLSFSLGLRGQQDHPSFHAAIERIVAACRKASKPVGRPAGTADAVERFQEQGFQFFQGPTEIGLLNNGTRNLLDPLGKSKLAGQRIRSFY